MNVSDIMTTEVVTIDRDQRADVALKIMEDKHLRHLITTNKGKPESIISNRDLLVGAYLAMTTSEGSLQTHHTVGQLATAKPIVFSPSTSIEEVLNKVIQEKVSAFPIMEGEELKGIVTTHDLMKLFAKLLEEKKIS